MRDIKTINKHSDRRRFNSLINFSDRRKPNRNGTNPPDLKKQQTVSPLTEGSSPLGEAVCIKTERRHCHRFSLKLDVSLQINGRVSAGKVVELSSEGLLLIAANRLSPSSRFTIQFSFGKYFCVLKTSAAVIHEHFVDFCDEKNGDPSWKIGLALPSLNDMERKVLESCADTLSKEFARGKTSLDAVSTFSNGSHGSIVEILISNYGGSVRQLGRQRVVVTGIGAITPIGVGVKQFWDAALLGTTGVRRIESFDPTKYPSQVAAEVQEFDAVSYLSDSSVNGLDRCVQFGLAAAMMALDDSGLKIDLEDNSRFGVSIGSGMGGIMMGERQLTGFYHAEMHSMVSPRLIPTVMANALAGQIATRFSIKGPNLTNSTACSSSAHSIGQALNLIRWGVADVMVAGGAEACISPVVFSGFCSLRALSTHYNFEPTHASRPFDQDRDGFVMGEGSGMLILESLEHAQARGAQIYGEIVGYGATSEAYHMVIPEPEGKEAARTMYLALEDAGLSPDSIDYLNAHATATKVGDIVEAKAIREVFGDKTATLPISATKSLIGHTIGAAGAIASIVCLMSLKTGHIHPTINLKKRDTLCDLNVVTEQIIDARIRTVMLNAFGFGSNNASLIFRRV